MVKEFIGDSIVGHVSRDSTAIPAREKPTPKCKSDQKPMKRKRGRPRKGEERPPKDKTRRNCSPPLRRPIILPDHVSGISVKRDPNGFDWIVSEFCHCIEITRYPAPGLGEAFCPETPRDFDFDL